MGAMGLPPDGTPGPFVGYTEAGGPFLMRWGRIERAWICLGFDPLFPDKAVPVVAMQRPETAERLRIVRWAALE